MTGAIRAVRHGVSTASRALALVVVVAAPLPFGSIEQPWPAIWSGLMGLSLLSAGPVQPVPPHVRRGLLALGGLAALWILVLYVQGSDAVRLGLPSAWPRPGDPTIADPMPLPVSASRQDPLLAAGPALLMALTFARFALLGADLREAVQALRVLRLAAIAIGCVSLAFFIVEPGQLLGRPKTYYTGSFTGTFINRNTAAAFFGTACLLWACHVRTLAPDGLLKIRGTLLGTVLSVTDRLNGGLMVAALMSVLCLGWTAMTGSRAGFLLTTGLLIPVVLWPVGRRRRRPGVWLLPIAAACLAILVSTLGGMVGARLSAVGLFDRYRVAVYRLCVDLIEAHPWLGIGLGQFETVFPTWRTPEIGLRGQWEFAHSTPLELVVEVGVPLALTTILAWLVVGIRILRADPHARRNPVRRPALAVLAFGAAHSLVDFSLQVPGYAIVFAAIVGCGFGGTADMPNGNTRPARASK